MTPTQLVEAQLDAYNARDIEAFCKVFSDDVMAYSLRDERILIAGMPAFRKTYESLFQDSPALHAKIAKRMVLGDFVIDEEEVTGRRGQSLHAAAIYKITGDKISHVWFAV